MDFKLKESWTYQHVYVLSFGYPVSTNPFENVRGV